MVTCKSHSNSIFTSLLAKISSEHGFCEKIYLLFSTSGFWGRQPGAEGCELRIFVTHRYSHSDHNELLIELRACIIRYLEINTSFSHLPLYMMYNSCIDHRCFPRYQQGFI